MCGWMILRYLLEFYCHADILLILNLVGQNDFMALLQRLVGYRSVGANNNHVIWVNTNKDWEEEYNSIQEIIQQGYSQFPTHGRIR